MTGDYYRSDGYLDQLSNLLDSGVKVTMLYGDRDYFCNWLGGEDLSLSVITRVPTSLRSWLLQYQGELDVHWRVGSLVREFFVQ